MDEFAWVIERTVVADVVYWTGGSGWSKDHLAAVRFARKEDADRAASYLIGWTVRITEHGWIQSTDGLEKMLDDSGEHIAQFFKFGHLREDSRRVSKTFAEQALRILKLPRNPERTVALRKLLESKDAAVRAAFAK